MGNKKQKKRSAGINKSNSSEIEKNFYEIAIKELSFTTKSNCLVVGTNETLRRLAREQLAAVFLFSNKASPPIYHSLSLSCRKTNVPFITLQDKDKFVLGTKFPTSVTYGVKKESVKSFPALDNILKEIRNIKKTKKPLDVDCETSFKMPELSVEESPSQELNSRTFYHKKHVLENEANSEWTDRDFLHFSVDKITFPDYDSIFKSLLVYN